MDFLPKSGFTLYNMLHVTCQMGECFMSLVYIQKKTASGNIIQINRDFKLTDK